MRRSSPTCWIGPGSRNRPTRPHGSRRPAPSRQERPPTVDPKALTVYTGTYVDASGAETVVKMDGTVLSLTTTRPPGRTVPLTPLAPHVFRMNGMAATRRHVHPRRGAGPCHD